jgi:hypothetical protein
LQLRQALGKWMGQILHSIVPNPQVYFQDMDIITRNPIQDDALKSSGCNPTELIELGHKEVISFGQPFLQLFLNLVF